MNQNEISQAKKALLSLGNRPGFANPYDWIIMNGPDVKIANNPADNHLVPAHSSGENILMHESLHGSNFFNVKFNIWSIENDQTSVRMTIKIIIEVKRLDNSEKCD